MALKTTDIDVEISKIQKQIKQTDSQLTKGIKAQDRLKAKQQNQVEKHRQLQAAKSNINKFNKAS
jgi:hypothetical protein